MLVLIASSHFEFGKVFVESLQCQRNLEYAREAVRSSAGLPTVVGSDQSGRFEKKWFLVGFGNFFLCFI